MRPLPPELQQLADAHCGVLPLRDLAAAGFSTHHVNRRIADGLWQRVTAATVATHRQPLSRPLMLAAAVLHFPEAMLTGRAALEVTGFPPDPTGRIDVMGRRVGRQSPFTGCVVHTSRRGWNCSDGFPARTEIPISVLHAMAWSNTDDQAAFIGIMAIQKGLTTLDQLGGLALSVNGSRTLAAARRRLQRIPSGAQSILELDFARMCRARGLPEPVRQAFRQDSEGRDRYVDALFKVNGRTLIVEIDGLQHLDANVKIDDQLRANSFALQGDTVLRIPGLALRTNPEPFMRQIRLALEQLRH